MHPLSIFRQFLNLMCIGLLCGMSYRASAVIYTCTDSEGQQTFTDRGCPGYSIYQPPSNPPVAFAPLNGDEIAQLKSLARHTAQTRLHRQKSNQQSAKRMAKSQSHRKQRCIEATAALAEIAVTRRKGYKLSAAQSLEKSQSSLQQIKKDNCA